jgi:hypothetical protein
MKIAGGSASKVTTARVSAFTGNFPATIAPAKLRAMILDVWLETIRQVGRHDQMNEARPAN